MTEGAGHVPPLHKQLSVMSMEGGEIPNVKIEQRHKAVFAKAAAYLNIDANYIESVARESYGAAAVDEFINDQGLRVFFYYQAPSAELEAIRELDDTLSDASFALEADGATSANVSAAGGTSLYHAVSTISMLSPPGQDGKRRSRPNSPTSGRKRRANTVRAMKSRKATATTTTRSDGIANLEDPEKPRLVITSGRVFGVFGTVLYMLRSRNAKTVTVQNIDTEVLVGELDQNILNNMRLRIGDALSPALHAQDQWGLLTPADGVADDVPVKEYLDELDRFSALVERSASTVSSGIELEHVEDKELVSATQPVVAKRLANMSNTVLKCEEIIRKWILNLESMLLDVQQVRKETEDIGPAYELEYWKLRSARFSFVTEQLKRKDIRAVVAILQTARSPLMKRWHELDVQITDALNEAKDNVRYLTSMQKYSEPLYKSGPVQMMNSVSGLMNSIKIMHSISRHYNTSERLTALFVKITNQMISCCKRYLMEDGSLWEQARMRLIEKMKDCIDLNVAYQENYHRAKTSLAESPHGHQFDFSEVAIFGRFDTFCRRLQRLMDMFSTIEEFSALSRSAIEGLEPVVRHFDEAIFFLRSKSYDLLDTRNEEYEADYEEFHRKVVELDVRLTNFVNDAFPETLGTMRALENLELFRNVLRRDNLARLLDVKYRAIFENYGHELDHIRQLYEKYKNDPPLPRNATPVSGAVEWSRQLLRTIEKPMLVFQHSQELMELPEARRIIRGYNKIARALLMYEELWHQGWCKAVSAAVSGLHATLLVLHPQNRRICVNYDEQVLQVIQEARHLDRMGLEVPAVAQKIWVHKDSYKVTADKLRFLIDEYYRVLRKIPDNLQALLEVHVRRVYKILEPGLTTLTWTSMNVDPYLARCYREVDELEVLIKKISDIILCRVNACVQQIENTELLQFPEEGDLVHVDEFVASQQEFAMKKSKFLNLKSQEVETAIEDLSKLLLHGTRTPADKKHLEPLLVELSRHYERSVFMALLACFRRSIKVLRRKVSVKGGVEGAKMMDTKSIFSCEVHLNLPHVQMNPSLTELQRSLNQAAKIALQVFRNVYKWGTVNRDLKNHLHVEVGSNKETVTCLLQLTGAVSGLQNECSSYLAELEKYNDLWEKSRHEALESFRKSEPTLDSFEEEIQRYCDVIAEINHIHDERDIGSIRMHLISLKRTLISECEDWKNLYGQELNRRSKTEMENLIEYMEQTTAILQRPIKDLEDVNEMMNTLRGLFDLESEIEMKVIPIEDAYSMLSKFDIAVSKEEQDTVDNMRYMWKKLITIAHRVKDHLCGVGPTFKDDLVSDVATFVVDVKKFHDDYVMAGPNVEGIKPRVAVERLKTFQRKFEERERKWRTYQMGEKLFGLPETEYPEMLKVGKELKLLSRLYDLYSDVIVSVNGYEDVLWADVNIDSMTNQLTDFQNKCRRMPKALREYQAYNDLKMTIDNFCDTLPILQMLKDPSMRHRHWVQIAELAGHELNYEHPEFKVKNLLDAELHRVVEDVEDVCNGGVKEADIEVKLQRIKDDWVDQQVYFAEFKTRGELTLKPGETSELMTLIEDSQMMLGSLLSNRYNAPFRQQIQQWVHKLTTAQEVIELWLQVQALWIYLEAVFSGGDIARQLPQEAKRFANIDKSWCKIMTSAQDNPNVIKFVVNDEMLRNLLPHLMESLEICQKSLSGYLEAKRRVFPRFYFVSDAQLLEILGQGSDPHSIQPHLLSIFANVARVDFDAVKKDKILRLLSAEGEMLTLKEPLMAEGNIEDWLNKLVTAMEATVNSVIRLMVGNLGVLDDFNVTKEQLDAFITKYPAQVALLALQIMWTHDSEDALARARSERHIMSQTNKKFQHILSLLVDLTTQELSKRDRTKIETLITIHIHQVDIFYSLFKMRIRSSQDFEWLKYTRLYWRPDKENVVISVTDVDYGYRNEYLGVTERLVITPLTDRIYISCSQAMAMFYGGAPAGPAGTGKTETTKDMGRTVGSYFITINCSDQMDYRGMGKLFKGIAESGVWCGFDEINRVHLEVLSVVAAQIACIFNALRDRKEKFVFTDGMDVRLNPLCACFITMNPGYAGRTELPENMKALFRTIAVVVPDRQIIMRVRLAASGFQENTGLAKKFFILYRLCEEQLSKQTHYDFGLRNILSVLRTAGSTKRSNPKSSETMVLMRVLRDMNLSKLVDEDEPLFLALISDLFPGINVEKENYGDLQEAIHEFCEENQIINSPGWNLKVIQLFEQWRVRHGICVMGPSGAGKTMIIRALIHALSKTQVPVKEYTMNPKAITDTQMFGRLDVQTNDWTDGIFSALWRRGCKGTKDKHTWILLDGPVDTIWIESLNTVLDDTRTLTLANGDRIGMPPTMKLVFEVEDLRNASPATVSRMGIIYMGLSALGWEPLLEAWVQKQPDWAANPVKDTFTKLIDPMVAYMRDHCEPRMDININNYVSNSLTVLDGLLVHGDEHLKDLSRPHMERLCTFALIWSFGALLETDDRRKLHVFLREKGAAIPSIPSDSNDTVFEYAVEPTGEWIHWEKRVPTWAYPSDHTPPFASILVPTVDNIRTDFLLELGTKQRHPVLIIGESGTAKTVTIQEHMGRQDEEIVKSKFVNFSSATTPLIFQRIVENSVEKRMGNSYGPPPGKMMMLFIDDVNMPEINEWGDQVTNEIVRQLMEFGGFYNLDKPGEWSNICDLTFLAAMNHPGGGRNDIPSRFKRHFLVYNVTLPPARSIEHIFGSIIRGHFCSERGFSEEVIKTATRITTLTYNLWNDTKKKMLPTPSKFHYIFNLRDLSRIFQGMLNVDSEVVRTRNALVQLWRHECQRVISDKFTTNEDVTWLNRKFEAFISDEYGAAVVEALGEEKYFVDFLRDPEEPDDPEEENIEIPKVYEPIESFDSLHERLQYYMQQYNDMYRKSRMELVLFEFAMKHLMRISRIIRTPRGNALLVGVGGSGKQSLTRLAAFIAGYKTFRITLTRTYNTSNLMDDLKVVYKMAAMSDGVAFTFTDNDVKEESFLEYINMILTSGEIPGLFPRDELDSVLEDLRPIAKKSMRGFIDTQENLYKFFIDRVRDNLHVVLCFSPVGEKFRIRCQKFPGLISGCCIDWFPPWPREALHSTATHFLSEFPLVATPEVKSQLVEHMCFVHGSVVETCEEYLQKFRRHAYVTPKSYLSFVTMYMEKYLGKHGEIKELADRVNTGLSKLDQASKDIANMKVELMEKEKVLAEAQRKSEELLNVITEQTALAEKEKKEVEAVKEECAENAAMINAEKTEAERDLDAAKPALEEAEAALNLINANDITTLRALKRPPNLIKRIFDGVLLLRHRPMEGAALDPELTERNLLKASWDSSKLMIGESSLLRDLQEFKKETINDETCELLAPYLEQEDFTTANAQKASGNVAGLCTWVRAMVTFQRIYKIVAPKISLLKEKEGSLQMAMKQLNEAQAKLDEKQRVLDAMMEKYDAAMAEKKRLEDDALLTKRRLESAEALIQGLGGERERWTQESKEFDDMIRRLVGDVAVTVAFLSYSGPFNQEFRDIIIGKWCPDLLKRHIPMTSGLRVTKFLTTEAEVGEWNLQGLPTDDLSVQNGIVVTTMARYPLLIDPQGQGKSWVINREEPNGLQVTNLNHKHFRTHLEDCLTFGRPILIEDVSEELDPVLDNVLEKQLIKSGRGFKVRLGDKEVDFSDGFRLYITTKLSNPNFTPEIFAKTAVINFSVTMKGLEDQLLGIVILKEKAELEEKRKELLSEINQCKKTVQKCEEDLLMRLSSSSGNLLDDTTLIDVLAQTKKISSEVKEKLQNAESTEAKISDAREEYRPVATRGSVMYFVITELSLISNMYMVSLGQFLNLFNEGMELSEKTPIAAKRIGNIIDFSTYHIYKYVQRGLYEMDKLTYSLLMALKIDLRASKIEYDSFSNLLRGGAALDLHSVRQKPFSWIPDNAWLNLVSLTEIDQFRTLLDSIQTASDDWKKWYDSERPETEPIPDGFAERLNPFRKLLLVRAFREDRAMVSAKMYIMDSLGQQFVEAIPLDLRATLEESDRFTPIVSLLSMGSDPTSSIEALAKAQKVQVRTVSMGQGQEIIARRLVTEAMATGSWVLLQNCHLAIPYMEELTVQLMELREAAEKNAEEEGDEDGEAGDAGARNNSSDKVDSAFRVWITTAPSERFPINLLQMSIKFTNEPPQGLKAGMRRAYAWITQDMLEAVEKPQWRPLLYILCFLHSTVIERKRFGPLGWCVPYEFNHTDLVASSTFLQNHVYQADPKRGISWSTVRYMVGEVQYGGRITDDYDKRLMETYCALWMTPTALGDQFEFYKGYTVPMLQSVQDYRKKIDTLPLVDTPEIFGMHSNAEISLNAAQTKEVLGTILDVQPKESSGAAGETREDVVLRIAKDLLAKLPPDYNKRKVKEKLRKLGGATPFNVFLRQEIDRIQVVLSLVRRTVTDLQLAIAGTIIMSADLQEALNSLYDAKVPPKWLKVSWDSPTLGYWFADVMERVDQFTTWLENGAPKSFWLTGFFNPQGFLTALRQDTTRKHSNEGWALDSVALRTEVLKYAGKNSIQEGPQDGLYIHGLFIEGAAWDFNRMRLVDSQPKVLHVAMPLVHVRAVNVADGADVTKPPGGERGLYVCPVYRLPRRTALNYVFDVTMPTDDAPEKWILRGVALLCSKV